MKKGRGIKSRRKKKGHKLRPDRVPEKSGLNGSSGQSESSLIRKRDRPGEKGRGGFEQLPVLKPAARASEGATSAKKTQKGSKEGDLRPGWVQRIASAN